MREIVTFDAYGTLVDFRLNAPTAELLKNRIAEVGVDTQEFLDTFNVMRFQAVLEGLPPLQRGAAFQYEGVHAPARAALPGLGR
jgi:FMN phosphatase YigB (HAD superfamily)